jgi:hypothetical protein
MRSASPSARGVPLLLVTPQSPFDVERLLTNPGAPRRAALHRAVRLGPAQAAGQLCSTPSVASSRSSTQPRASRWGARPSASRRAVVIVRACARAAHAQFWQAAQSFRSLARQATNATSELDELAAVATSWRVAEELFDRYVAEGARDQINVAHAVRETIATTLREASRVKVSPRSLLLSVTSPGLMMRTCAPV